MTAFIRQEALEKAREIEIKADEEFAIEKSKLVRQETAAIDSQYEKKFKQAAMSQQITRSTLANKTRLKVLSARQEVLDELFERARAQLPEYTRDRAKYRETLKNLILEGAYALNEERILVRAREEDDKLVRRAMGEAQREFKERVKRDIAIELDEANPLPEARWAALSGLLGSRLALLTSLVLGGYRSWVETARLRSSTRSRNAFGCFRAMLCRPYVQCSSDRMRTASSMTERVLGRIFTLLVYFMPLHWFWRTCRSSASSK